MPGVIDTAVQFDPGSDGAVWQQESAAAVSGGVTTVMALPDGEAPIVDQQGAKERCDRIAGRSWCDFGLWAAARQDNQEELVEAYDRGLVAGFLALVGGATSECLPTEDLPRWLQAPGVLGVQLVGAPGEEVSNVLNAVRSHERPTHIVNLSTAAELDLVDPVRGDLPLTAGVTPHHLFLSLEDEDARSIRAHPPLRPEHDRRTLWTAIKRGRLDCVASDHHPSTPEAREGVPGSELLLPLMMSAVRRGRLSLEMLVSLCCEGPARIFGLPQKGRIAKGADADLVLFTEGQGGRVAANGLLSSAGWSPYVDREASPKPEMVFVAGQLVAQAGQLSPTDGVTPSGRPVRQAMALPTQASYAQPTDARLA